MGIKMEWYVLALISAVIVSIIPIIRKKVLVHEHASEFTTTVYLTMAVLFIPLLPSLDYSMNATTFFLLLLKGIFLTVASLLFIKAARHMEISAIEPLRNLSVVFVLVLGYFTLGEIVSLQQGIGLILIVAGAYALEVHKHKITYSIPSKKFVWFILFNLVLVSIMAIMDKVLVKRTDIYTIVIIPALIMAIVMFFYQSLKYKGFEDILHAIRTGRWNMVVLPVLTVIADATYLMALAIPGALVALVIALRRTSTLLSSIIGGEIFHDHFLLQKCISSLVMLAGVYIILF